MSLSEKLQRVSPWRVGRNGTRRSSQVACHSQSPGPSSLECKIASVHSVIPLLIPSTAAPHPLTALPASALALRSRRVRRPSQHDEHSWAAARRCVVRRFAGTAGDVATNTREMPVPPEQVWAVLADAEKYHKWVVGAKEVRSSEGHWPAKGARFHHTVGIWPLHVRDQTSVLESDSPTSLVLEAKVRPFGKARIDLELFASAGGTQVAMTEEPSAPFIARIARRLLDPVIYVRNGEALRRLENLVRQVDM